MRIRGGPPWRARAKGGVSGRRSRNGKSPRTSRRHGRLWLRAPPADSTRHRAEVHVLEIRLGGLEASAGRPVAIDAHEGASGKKLRRDDGVLPLQCGKLVLLDHPAPYAAPKIIDGAQRLGLEQDLPSVDDCHPGAQLT